MYVYTYAHTILTYLNKIYSGNGKGLREERVTVVVWKGKLAQESTMSIRKTMGACVSGKGFKLEVKRYREG